MQEHKESIAVEVETTGPVSPTATITRLSSYAKQLKEQKNKKQEDKQNDEL